ncbi:hypothetical protein Ddye_002911 [Dipteronia dyeriana]|uniref:DCD domain-containing protein n=1 Tax=Dipteronia dyeriana TaxID=168575 RepID=A0AAD9XSF3_9ROSI|nr:hypothetical protein Ddye_002911 [Dipteronia dyeriana]
MENNNQQSFYQFSDQLRVQASNLANLSLNDSIWSNSHVSKRTTTNERRNFDIRVGGGLNNSNNYGGELNNNYNSSSSSSLEKFNNGGGGGLGLMNLKPAKGSDYNLFDDGYNKMGITNNNMNMNMNNMHNINDIGLSPYGGSMVNIGGGAQKNNGINGGFNKGIYSKPGNFLFNNDNHYMNVNLKGNNYNKNKEEDINNNNNHGSKIGKKNNHHKKNYNNRDRDGDNNNTNNENKESNKTGVDKRFKTLPPSEALPRNETIGGYIFVCNNDTMAENLKRQLFGLPPRYRDSVRAITPGLPLFLYNYSTHQLHGIFEAAGFGGTNIDPSAWEDKKCPGESRFPAQVQVITRKICEPLEEDSFRPILHHYDGPKFRLELNIPEVLINLITIRFHGLVCCIYSIYLVISSDFNLIC